VVVSAGRARPFTRFLGTYLKRARESESMQSVDASAIPEGGVTDGTGKAERAFGTDDPHPSVELRGVTKRFDELTAVDELRLQLTCALLGTQRLWHWYEVIEKIFTGRAVVRGGAS
jgi:hypothetical protein